MLNPEKYVGVLFNFVSHILVFKQYVVYISAILNKDVKSKKSFL